MLKNLSFAVLMIWLAIPLIQAQQPITTQHGFRFINHTHGSGMKPRNGESIMVHVDTYIGDTLIGSTHKDGGSAQEYRLPNSTKLHGRISFIYDAALLMAEGDSATVCETIDSTIRRFVPASKQSETDVRYEVKIVQIITKKAKDKKLAEIKARLKDVQTRVHATIKDYVAGNLKDQVTTLPSGVKLLVVKPGTGASVKAGEWVKADYFGCLVTGKMFDNSYQYGGPVKLLVGVDQLGPGFFDTLLHINHGSSAYFFMPHTLAYGIGSVLNTAVPPKSDLVFYVELQ